MKLQGAKGDVINSFESWKSFGLPPSRAAKHWKEGRSACAFARAWTSAGVVGMLDEVSAYLESNAAFRGLRVLSGMVERETVLPFVNAGPRCHDLVVVGHVGEDKVLISIEAKADEEFDKPAEVKLIEAMKNPRTTFPDRLEWLTTSILGLASFPDGHLKLHEPARWLPYQLLSGLAGTLLEAQVMQASKAIFLIHEFKTSLTRDINHARNSATLNRFLDLLCEANGISPPASTIKQVMLGPIYFSHIPRARGRRVLPHLPKLPLYIGKIVTNTR